MPNPCRGVVFNSPAKINLFFRVHKKRSDGYHEISSLYQTIDLFDQLQISFRSEDLWTCTDPSLALDEKNLISKAVSIFRKKTGWNQQLEIHLQKNIPMEAGLGGGSGNAATALWALNHLSGLKIADEELALWAGELGSDIPFFFSLGTAYCRGRGEIISRLPPLPVRRFWLAKPSFGLSTPRVYQHCRPSDLPERNPEIYLEKAVNGELEFFNDLEVSAWELSPELKQIQNQLLAAGFQSAVLTGSGTGIVCFSEEEKSVSSPPQIENVRFYPVAFTQREEGHWYG